MQMSCVGPPDHWEISMLERALMILIGMTPGFALAVALAATVRIH
jgi:hypothetical protein